MDTARFARLRELFEQALGMDPAERAGWLDGACAGDPALAREARRMLAAHDAPDFLAPPDEGSAAPPPLPERLGPYRILDVVGEGGFGVVYRAEQLEPVRRTVALKVLHRTRTDEVSVLRFQAEAQALARLEHPGIARLYDAGRLEDGQSFIAMEYVVGTTITSACDARVLDLDTRLGAFLRVCSAVQHAHQRGVVHRDLKPSNVLVEKADGPPRPRVVDFGIAKLVDEAAAGSGVTRAGSMVGTPGAMSPEQAAGETVDTRTDVYALGVLLYELLTGDLPLGRERLEAVGVAEALRRVREEEPRSLAAALREAGPAAREVAARRGVGPAALERALRGDLEWIVRRALARDPDDRYASVTELVADVERFRRDQPVSAREPVTTYLLRKFVARHRMGVAVAGAALVALIVGLAGLAWALRAVSDARDQAVLNEYAAHLAAAAAALDGGDAEGARRRLASAAEEHRGWEWRHLAARCDTSLARYPLDDDVWQVAWLDDERLLVRASDEGQNEGVLLRLDLETGAVAPLLEVHKLEDQPSPELDDFLVDRAGGRVVVDVRLRLELHDLAGGGAPRVLHEALDDVRSMALAPDGRTLYTSDNGGAVRVLDLDGTRPARVLCRLEVHCDALLVLSGGARLALATSAGEVQLRDTEGGALLAPPTVVADEYVRALVASADEQVLFAAAARRVHALDAHSGTLLARRSAGVELQALDLSSDGRLLYGSGDWEDAGVLAWDAATLELRSRFHGHRQGVRGLAASPDGERLATGSRDGTLRLWPALAPPPAVRLEAGYDVRDLSLAADGRAFATADRRGWVTVWDAASLAVQGRFELPTPLRGCALGADAVYVAGAELYAVDRDSGAVRQGDPPPLRVGRLAIDPAERWLVATHWVGARLSVWSLPELRLVHDLELPVYDSVVFDPSRRAFLVSTTDGRVLVVDPDGGRVLEALSVPGSGRSLRDDVVWDVAVNGGEVAAVRAGLHLLGGDDVRTLTVTTMVSAAYAPDGERLAGGAWNRYLRLWNRQGTEVLALEDAPKPIEDLGFVAGGRHLVGLSYLPGSLSYLLVWSAPERVEIPE